MSGGGGRGDGGARDGDNLNAVELVAVARVAKARGVRGEVSADVLTDFPERFDRLGELIAFFPGGSRRRLALEGHWLHGARVVLKFRGFDSPEEVAGEEDDQSVQDGDEGDDGCDGNCRSVAAQKSPGGGDVVRRPRDVARTVLRRRCRFFLDCRCRHQSRLPLEVVDVECMGPPHHPPVTLDE